MQGQADQRAAVLHEVAQGQLTAVAAAALLGLSERQVRRLLAAYLSWPFSLSGARSWHSCGSTARQLRRID